jgi:hypothetical protein
MRAFIIPALVFSLIASALAADTDQTLYFAKSDQHETTTVKLVIKGTKVTGTHEWLPTEKDGAHGTITGTMKDDLISVIYNYEQEGSQQSEEKMFKLNGDTLLMGEGELVDPKNNGKLKLKDRSKVTFETVLKKVPVTEPKAGSPERKALMDAMRDPVTKKVGQPVTFTGIPRIVGDWASFQGTVATTDVKPAKNANAQDVLELEFFALLQKTAKGEWKVIFSGSSGDTRVRDEAREKYPKAPWPLMEWAEH